MGKTRDPRRIKFHVKSKTVSGPRSARNRLQLHLQLQLQLQPREGAVVERAVVRCGHRAAVADAA